MMNTWSRRLFAAGFGMRMVLMVTVMAALVLGTAAPARAMSQHHLDKIERAAIRGDHTALARLRHVAAQGNAMAQNALSDMYNQGHGVPQDYAKSLFWLRKAAAQGLAVAQSGLGISYESGDGYDGIWTPDYAKALFWDRKAAAQGDDWAQNSLGIIYALGQGVPQDYVAAYKWFELAKADSRPGRPGYRHASIHLKHLALRMTPKQIGEAQAEAEEWTLTHPHAAEEWAREHPDYAKVWPLRHPHAAEEWAREHPDLHL